MLYLFKNAAEQPSGQKDVWLTQEGDAVLVSSQSTELARNPIGSRLVGKITADDASPFQLTDGDALTETGKKYCEIMGVQQTASDLQRFVAVQKNNRVVLDAVISNTPVPA
jgi:hypothetical protein